MERFLLIAIVLLALAGGTIVVCSRWWQGADSPKHDSGLSRDEAVSLLVTTAARMGAEVEKDGVEVRAAYSMNSWEDGQRGTRQRISSGRAEIEVNAVTREVISYWDNEAIAERTTRRARDAAGVAETLMPMLTAEEAVRLATEYLHVFRGPVPGDLELKPCPIFGTKEEPVVFDEETAIWRVTWHRFVEGYPFLGQGVWVALDDRTKALIFVKWTATAVVPVVALRIDAEKARNRARRRLDDLLPEVAESEGRSFEISECGAPELYIAVPTDYPPITGTRPRRDMVPRLVYALPFTLVSARDEKGYHEAWPYTVWVDAGNGRICGGL